MCGLLLAQHKRTLEWRWGRVTCGRPTVPGGKRGSHLLCTCLEPKPGADPVPPFSSALHNQLYSWERGVKEAREHPPGEKETGELSVLPLSLTESHSPGSAGTATVRRSWEDTREGAGPGQWPKWAGGKLSFQCNTKQDCLETEEMQERLYTHRLEAKSWSASGLGVGPADDKPVSQHSTRSQEVKG